MASNRRKNSESDASEEGEEEWAEDQSSHSSSEEWEEEGDEEESSLHGRSLLWLCQEGQTKIARCKFDSLLKDPKQCDLLERQVFQQAPDKNYALHELLMGGTDDANAYQLTVQILEFCQQYPDDKYRDMLITQPSRHQKRTALHWAAWGNAKMDVLKPLIFGNPEALVLKDTAGRTPYDILKWYYCLGRNDTPKNLQDPRLLLLQKLTQSWTQHCLRRSIHHCAVHYFVTHPYTPFDTAHRQQTGMKPKAWFVLSLLGTLLQREMKPLVHHILAFAGGTAKVATTTSTGKKRTSKNDSGKKKKQRRGG